jgi:DNA-directed RNA polymerase subunit RPC12/RpoP
MSQPMRTMLRCREHGLAPGGVICVHLARGESKDWIKVGAGPECEHDYVCAACAERINDLDAADLKAICMHCIRALQSESA